MEPQYVKVYTANGQLDAEMIKGFLQAQRIHAMTSGESVGSVYGLSVGPLGEVDVLVPQEEAEEAADLLRRMEAGEFEDSSDDESGKN